MEIYVASPALPITLYMYIQTSCTVFRFRNFTQQQITKVNTSVMSASINNKRPYESGSDVLSSSNNSKSFVNTGSNDDVVVDDDEDDEDDDIVRREEKPLEAYMERISEVEIAKRTKYIK